jgi:hypothetical protein
MGHLEQLWNNVRKSFTFLANLNNTSDRKHENNRPKIEPNDPAEESIDDAIVCEEWVRRFLPPVGILNVI